MTKLIAELSDDVPSEVVDLLDERLGDRVARPSPGSAAVGYWDFFVGMEGGVLFVDCGDWGFSAPEDGSLREQAAHIAGVVEGFYAEELFDAGGNE